MDPMPAPVLPLALAAEPVAVDLVQVSCVPVLLSVSSVLVEVPVKLPPPVTVHESAAFAGAVENATAAATAAPVTRVLLVRVESLRTGWSFLGVDVLDKPDPRCWGGNSAATHYLERGYRIRSVALAELDVTHG
jgi:hypothetical protein